MAQKLIALIFIIGCVGCTTSNLPYKNAPHRVAARYGVETTCAELKSYIELPSKMEGSTLWDADEWSARLFPQQEGHPSFVHSDGITRATSWSNDTYFRMEFVDDQFYSLDMPINMNAQAVTECLSAPNAYQAFEAPLTFAVDGDNPIVLKLTLLYQSSHFALEGHQNSIIFQNPSDIRISRFRHWREDTSPRNIISEIKGEPTTWTIDEWEEHAIQPWQGWDNFSVIPYSALGQPPIVDVMATQTVIAPLIRAVPDFPLAQAADSPACQQTLIANLFTLGYGHSTIQETRTILTTLYPLDSISIEEEVINELLIWNIWHEGPPLFTEQAGYFNNGILQYSQVSGFFMGPKVKDIITCFGAPSDWAIHNTTLYLYFPKQGVVSESYVSNNDEMPLKHDLGIDTLLYTAPTTNTLSLMIPIKEPALLQSWQSFEQLSLGE